MANVRKLLDPEIRAKNLREIRLRAREWWCFTRRPLLPDPVFVIGCSRSGTTVTFETIAASHAFRYFDYELPQFWNSLWGPKTNGWESEAAGPEVARPEHRRAALAYYYARLGTGQVLDKTCINTMRVGYLYRLFPDAKFVFIHRDGRDNVSSMMDGWRYGRTDGAFGLSQFHGPPPEPVAINGGEFREWHFFLPPGWRDYNRASLEEVCAYQWITANRLAVEASRSVPGHQWIQVRYEDIFERPVEMFQAVFEKLGVPYTEALKERCRSLASRPTSIVKGAPAPQKWRAGPNRAAIERILPMIAPMMIELGYDPND